MSTRDVGTLTDTWFTTFVIYLYGHDVLVGIDIESTDFKRSVVTYTVNVPECDLQVLQEQYQNEDDASQVIPKGFAEAYQFLIKTQRDVYRRDDRTWRSRAWIEGKVG